MQGTARFHIGDSTMPVGSMIRIPPDVEHWAEVIGDEPVMNLDVFNPIREDYKHLVEHQKGNFEEVKPLPCTHQEKGTLFLS